MALLIAMAAVGYILLLFGAMRSYDLVSNSRPSSGTQIFVLLGLGSLLTLTGIVGAAIKLDSQSRGRLGSRLLVLGTTITGAGLFLAHVGPFALIVSIPTMFAGAIVKTMETLKKPGCQ